MQKKINKFIWLLIPILLLMIGILVGLTKQHSNIFEQNFFYMDTYIYVKLDEQDENKAKKALEKIDSIYQDYHILADRYQEYEGIHNIYTIHNNQETDDTLPLDPRLYDMIQYGKDWYIKSNGKIDISMGNVLDVWKRFRTNQSGIPTLEELQVSNTSSIDDIILLDNYKIQNNHVNIDLGAIAKGYATEMVGQYLESIGIKNYLINAGGNVKIGIPREK